ncbi:DUF1697 domain-containing protein [Paeniglutamicibacter cryotolerans]|uniref:Uncharacterized protein (DUF1697 family) n=1 Tax=Paeniglutamicibacter cryotolerans TaxID=670079 RepID=A0A839QI93_9MICC|nr:DUF1697 domain-containing protein [Paeniglutamicibacter cryotolerans]MBB2994464.1 uncharacterized protein (DUF1697 family) [Paeniglutamicibacter cryotolerans]
MNAYAVFLRGINVNGVKILMSELGSVLTEAGFESVKTLLASGNVVLTADTDDADQVKERCEAALREAFGYEAWVIVRRRQQLQEALAAYPFTTPNDGTPRHAYITLATGEAEAAALLDDAPEPSEQERAAVFADVVFWEAPKGGSTTTSLARHFAKAKFQATTTTRNRNTIEKVIAALPQDA